jgi:hypothetical protein
MAWRFYTALGAEKASTGSISDRGTSFPASPFDGQEFSLVVDATNGVVWRFKYNAGSASAFKWEFIGGGAIVQNVSAHFIFNTMNQVGATGWYYPTGLSWSAIRAGDYEVDGIINFDPNGANAAPFYSDSFAGSVVTSAGAGETYFTDITAAHNQFSYSLTRINGVTAAQTIGLCGLAPTPGTNKFDQGWVRIRPIRLS